LREKKLYDKEYHISGYTGKSFHAHRRAFTVSYKDIMVPLKDIYFSKQN